MAWLLRNDFVAGEAMSHAYLNNAANDQRNWGGNVNGGGFTLSNVIITSGSLTNAGTLALAATGANVITFSTNGAERARILANGNVGIGLTSPGVPLDVAGTIRSISGGIDIRMAADIGGIAGFGTYSNHGIIFVANGAEAMRLAANGNLAINKPGGSTVKLAVAGLPTYADNTAAVGGGLTAGDFYRTATGVLGVVF